MELLSNGKPNTLASYREFIQSIEGNIDKALKYIDDRIAREGSDSIVKETEHEMLDNILKILKEDNAID